MRDLDLALFVFWNLTPVDPPWVVELARMSSGLLPLIAIFSLVALILLGSRRLRHGCLEMALGMVIVWLLVTFINDVWPQPRPFVLGIGHLWIEHKPTSGFPSRHGAVGLAFGFSAVLVSPVRWLGVLGLIIGLSIAWSRVALGVHFPSDVIAGGLIAALVVAVVHWLLGLLKNTDCSGPNQSTGA